MSRSQPTLQNPAHRFFEYKPQTGILKYYDKETSENVPIPLPFEFLVLAQTAKIGGFSKPDNAGYYSNEVTSMKQDFIIKLKGKIVYMGRYKNDQGAVQIPKAAKYIKTLYIMYKEQNEWMIGNLSLPVGSPLSAWIEFTKKHKSLEDTGKVIMERGIQEEAPTGKYYPPAFTYQDSNDDEEKYAIMLDKVIQAYLTRYLAMFDDNHEDEEDEPINDTYNTDNGKASPEQIADFERRKAEKFNKPVKAEDYPEDNQDAYNRIAEDEDIPFTDEDIPAEFR